ncbi:ceramide glucosyltransferase-like isoform X2 [Gigantopelta aegis]|nr:ceramide glucosyltransferase-like isoform X2 [Gigantopelta aegis]
MYLFDAQAYSYLGFFLGIVALLLYGFTLFLTLISLVGGYFHFHRKSDPSLLGDDLPGVSIVKPLMGVDPLLLDNLESFFKLKYQKIELLLCVQDSEDPCIHLISQLQETYPKTNTKLFIGGRDGIINPMVHNMTPGYEAAKYEYVWISSSRIKASDDIITDMVCKLQKPTVALVHQMPFMIDQQGLGATVEKIYFGCLLHRFYPAFSFLQQCCVTGMSYMVKKSLLDQVNGLGWYGRFLAEDFFLTKALHDKGYKLVLSAFPAQQNTPPTSLCGFFNRMVRWLRLRFNMLLIVSMIEPFMDVIPLGLLNAWSLNRFFGTNPYVFFPLHLLLWMTIDYLLLKNAQNGPVCFSKVQYALAWLLRECLSTLIFIKALLKPHTIVWGKRTFYVQYGGHTKLIQDKTAVSL